MNAVPLLYDAFLKRQLISNWMYNICHTYLKKSNPFKVFLFSFFFHSVFDLILYLSVLPLFVYSGRFILWAECRNSHPTLTNRILDKKSQFKSHKIGRSARFIGSKRRLAHFEALKLWYIWSGYFWHNSRLNIFMTSNLDCFTFKETASNGIWRWFVSVNFGSAIFTCSACIVATSRFRNSFRKFRSLNFLPPLLRSVNCKIIYCRLNDSIIFRTL